LYLYMQSSASFISEHKRILLDDSYFPALSLRL
jgi:hypothetical protein